MTPDCAVRRLPGLWVLQLPAYGGQSAGVGLVSLQHRQEVHGIAGLFVYADRHGHLVAPIDRGLGVVDLFSNVSSL